MVRKQLAQPGPPGPTRPVTGEFGGLTSWPARGQPRQLQRQPRFCHLSEHGGRAIPPLYSSRRATSWLRVKWSCKLRWRLLFDGSYSPAKAIKFPYLPE